MARTAKSIPSSEPATEPVTAPAEAPAVVVKAFKAFDVDLKCRNFQYAVGETYKHKGRVEVCGSGFHSCEMPFDILNYYPLCTSRFALVAAGGTIDRHHEDSKLASGEITIKAEIKIPDLVREAVAWILKKVKGSPNTATGDRGHAAATGYSGHAAATGYSGHAAATGDSGHAAVKGKDAIAVSLGRWGTAAASENGWIVLASYDEDGGLLAVRSAKVGGPEGIKAGVTYRLSQAGDFEAVE